MEHFELRLMQDADPLNPRDAFDHCGTMVCFHNRYNLGDKHTYNEGDFTGWDDLLDTLKQDYPAGVYLPLYLFDHSGLTLRTTDGEFRAVDQAGWDWGQVGWAVLDGATIAREWGGDKAKAEAYLQAEVAEYAAYVAGDVWGFQVVDTATDEVVDSCWGYYGEEAARDEGEQAMGWHINHLYQTVPVAH